MAKKVEDAVIVKEILKIQERDGVCSPEALVSAAQSPKSPIHSLFEWDDSKAAKEWRKHQARQIVASFKIELSGQRAPQFVHANIVVDGKAKEGYLPIEVAMDDEAIRRQIFREARAALAGWNARLAAFRQADASTVALRQAIELLREEEG